MNRRIDYAHGQVLALDIASRDMCVIGLGHYLASPRLAFRPLATPPIRCKIAECSGRYGICELRRKALGSLGHWQSLRSKLGRNAGHVRYREERLKLVHECGGDDVWELLNRFGEQDKKLGALMSRLERDAGYRRPRKT